MVAPCQMAPTTLSGNVSTAWYDLPRVGPFIYWAWGGLGRATEQPHTGTRYRLLRTNTNLAEVNRSLGVPAALDGAAGPGHQREDVSGAVERRRVCGGLR